MKNKILKTVLVLFIGLGVGYVYGTQYQNAQDTLKGIQAGVVTISFKTGDWEWYKATPDSEMPQIP